MLVCRHGARVLPWLRSGTVVFLHPEICLISRLHAKDSKPCLKHDSYEELTRLAETRLAQSTLDYIKTD